MCDCFHLAFPNWHAASSGTGPGRRLRGPEPGTEDDSVCDEPAQFTEGERPRPQGSSPVEEYPETEKYSDSDKECEAEHDPHHRSDSGKKTKKSGLGSMFEKRSTPKMSKLKEVHSPESGVIVKTAKDGCAEGLIYGGGGKEGIFIKEVVPESPASKSLKLKEGDQVLSATVYFDNVSYEDAIQILEHAQAYKVKLCLKRKPDITETEPTIESDVIPEEDVYAPEMREQGKTKKRGDARISWPKFPSFGKGRKSHFRRSHSSSEADEQRKLELSPTTSDTESPIKSQDALKGKKKHKIKLSSLTKRGRISSSEDQDTNAPTSGQISGNILQTHEASDMLSTERLESPSGETPEVYVSEDLKVVEDLRLEQNDQKLTEPQTVHHKVELITIGSTLKTEDLTVALAGQESPSGIKSPDGKKKKKEKSELKMKILGKDKLHKKDAKAKSSPKRLKTLGASIEISDQPENEKSDVIPSFESHTQLDANTQIVSSESSRVISAKSVTTQMEMSAPKVELDISDVAFVQKSPQKGEGKAKKGKDKQKQETKTGSTFKLPKVGFSGIATEETIQKMNVNVEERTAKTEQLTTEGTEVKEDPYERLSKGSLSRTKLPKREDIEIPGMEDMRTKAKGIKEPKAVFLGHYEDIQAETVQMSIDVDSVKEAVSKLPGFKLPKVDDSGVPIPEEITVIDANAQRISVKTPTKVVDTKAKHEAYFTKFDLTASPEISKTSVKLPKTTPADLTSEELLIETRVDLKTTEMKAKITTKPDIKIPNIGIDLPKQNISEPKGDDIKGESTIFLQEVKTLKTETRKGKGQIGGVISDVKIPEIDGIEYIDSVDGSPAKNYGGIRFTSFGVNLDATKPNADISFPEIRSEVKDVEAEEHTIKLPKFGAVTPDISVHVPDADKDINIDGAEIKTLERERKGSKFKMPNLGISMPKVKGPKIDLSLSKKDRDVTLPEAKAEVKLPEVPEVDVTLGNIDVSIPEQKMEVEKPELEIKPLQTEGELDGQGGKFKMPKFGIKMPKIKGPEFDLSLSKKDGDVTLPDVKAEGTLPEVPETDITLGNVDVSIPEQKMEVKKPQLEIKPLKTGSELDGQGSKFKMPKLGIAMPKVKGPEIDFSLSEKDIDVTLPEAKAEVKFPDAELQEPSVKVEIKAPEIKGAKKDAEGSPSKFKMPTFKLPRFGGATPNVNVEISNKTKAIEIPEAQLKPPQESVTVDMTAPGVDIEGPSLDVKTTAAELDGKGSKFKMPKFGISLPKVQGPDIDLSLSKKDVDVTLPEADAEAKLPEAPKVDVSLGKADVSLPEEKLEVKKPELEMQGEVELDGQGGKFKMPKLGMSMPKVKGPEIHFGVSKKDGDVTLPQAKAEVKVPEVELKEPSAKLEIKAPDIKVAAKGTEGSPSKFKMPTFKLPKFGHGTPTISAEVPDMDKDVKIDGADINITEEESAVNIAAPSIDIEGPSIDMKTTGTEQDGKGSKFKMPHLGFSMPKVKGPQIDLSLSKKDVDVTLPEANADVKLPEVDLGKADVSIPETKMEVKKPQLEKQSLQTEGEFDGQGEHFKMPKFGIKMPKVKGPEIDLSLSKKDVDVTLPQTKVEVELPDAPKIDVRLGKTEVLIPGAKAKAEKPELEVKPLQTEFEGKGSKFKMPKFGMSMPKAKGPEFHLGFSKKDVDVTLPEAKADVNLPDVELKEPSAKVEIKAPEIEVVAKDKDGSTSKFKMPNISFSTPKVKGPDIDLSLSKKDTDITLPGTKAEVKLLRAPKVDASLGKAEVLIPEAKVEVKKPEVEIKSLQTDVDLEGKGGKFKMPKFGITMPKVKGPEIDLSFSKKGADVTLPEAKAEVELPDVELKEPSAKVEIKAPAIEAQFGHGEESASKFKLPTFELPKFGAATPNVSAEVPDMDIKVERAVDVASQNIDFQGPSLDVKMTGTEGKGTDSKFKMPKFGISLPKVQGPEIDVSLSKKDVDVKLPEAKAEVKLPEAPKMDVKLGKVDVSIPEAKMEIKKPQLEIKTLQSEGELDGQGSKYKMPKFGMSMPKVKGPEIDFSLSKKDVDITLPEAKAEISLPDAELKEPSAKVEIKSPEIEAQLSSLKGSPSKYKMPTFKFPKFGSVTANVSAEAPDIDKEIKIDGADMHISAPHTDVDLPKDKAEVHLPEVKVKEPSGVEVDAKLKKPRFSLPRFSFSKPSVKAPEVDVSLPDVNVAIPEGKVEVKVGEVDMKPPECEAEVDGQGSKFKMPKFGMSMPKVTGPEIDLSLSKKDVDVTLPEAKAEVKLPDVELKKPSAEMEIKAPEIKVATKDTEGSPSKFKMPTFKLPKFGVGMPSTTAEVPDTYKDGKVDGADIKIPEEVLTVEIAAPSIDTEGPSIDMKTTGTEHEGKGSKFKMPKFGITMPKVAGPDIDLSLSKKDVDVTLPEAKAEVKLPDVELKEPSAKVEIKAPAFEAQLGHGEGSASKFKLPTFKLPKFGAATPHVSAEVPDMDIKVEGAGLKIPKEGATVDVASQNIDFQGPSLDVKMTGTEGKGTDSKFKMPKFGISLPKVQGPEIDVSLSKKDVDVKLPEAKAEVKLPEAPKVDVSLGKADVSLPEEKLEVKKPELEMQSEVELDPQGSKFKMPKFGMSMPKVKGPEIDLSLSKKDVDVTLPEAKAEVKLPDVGLKKPSAEVEIKAPEIKVATKDTKGSPSKFKMPTFKLPKFGVGMPSATAEVPDTYKDGKIDGADIKIPEEVLTVDIAAPSIDTEGPSIDMKTTGTEHEGKGSKFKMPKFGITMPKVTGPEIDLSLSKKDVDVTLPEAKAEVKLPDVGLKKPSAEVEIKAPEIKVATKDTEGSPSKFKMPTFKLPKFGVGMPSATVEVPDTYKDGKVDGADIKIPEEVLTVEITAPSIDTEGPSIDMKTTGTEHEGKGSKFKLPKFGITMPKVTGPEIDLSLSKKDVDVTLPEAKAEVKLPDIELKKPSAEVEIKAPGIDVQTSTVEGSPSKFKIPTFKLPKFGAATPQVNVEVPDVDKQIEVAGADIKLPETKAEVRLPDVKIKESVGSISVSQAPITEGDAKLKKTRFSLPKFSFSKQSTKEREVDVSLPDVDVSLPERNVEVKQPEVELKPPEVDVELKGQESKIKMPKFGISMPKVKGPEIDLSLSKKDVDVTLPEAKAEVQLPDVKIKQPSAKVEIKAPEIEAQAGNVEGSPSKLKMPTFTLPKFGVATPKVNVEVPDVDKDLKIDGAKPGVPKEGATVDVTAPSVDTEGLSVNVKAKGSGLEGSGTKFKMPNFGISMPKVKGPEIDLSLSKKDIDVTLPEAKAVEVKDVEVKEPEGAISVPDVPKVEVEAKSKGPNWTFPKFSFSRTGGKAPDVDVNLETPKVDVTSPEAKAEVCLTNVEVQGPSGAISMEEPPAAELDANLKKTKFSLPRFSFAKSSVKEPEVSAELPHVEVSLPEGEVTVKQPKMEIKAPELEAERDGQGSKFKLPKFGIALPKTKGPEEDFNASQKDVEITLPEVKAEVKLPEIGVKESSARVEIKASEIEAKSKDVGGSPLKFKMPTVKTPKFGGATYDVTVEAPDADKVAETDGAKLKEDVSVNIKDLSVDIKTDSETPKAETDSVGLVSPSKFRLPSFKMPKLSFSRPKPEDEYIPVQTECKEDQLEMEVEPKGESKSPKLTLTSFGEILKNIDVEFDVTKTDNVEENVETSKEVHKTDEPSGKQLEAKEKETNSKQNATKSPERTGWFKFPRFGLSSPSEPAKIPEKDKDDMSPARETVDEEISPTCSVQSSDAFADISSAMTSEHVGLSLSSPTKVTVKYCDPNVATGHGEMHSNIITSTTRTELISVEPNLPEKITILSSGVSSSSEDTLRLESGKIHVITSNIQATPESQHAKLLTDVQVQSAGGLPLQSEANKVGSWTVEDSQSGKRTVYERHVVRETSSGGSESKETIVITKQITRMFDSSEPISGETASSIQRLKDSVHSEKMRFFDGAEK